MFQTDCSSSVRQQKVLQYYFKALHHPFTGIYVCIHMGNTIRISLRNSADMPSLSLSSTQFGKCEGVQNNAPLGPTAPLDRTSITLT